MSHRKHKLSFKEELALAEKKYEKDEFLGQELLEKLPPSRPLPMLFLDFNDSRGVNINGKRNK